MAFAPMASGVALAQSSFAGGAGARLMVRTAGPKSSVDQPPHYTGYCGANDNPVIWIMDYSPPGPAPQFEDLGLYSLIAFAALLWMVFAYGAAPVVTLWEPPPVLRWVVPCQECSLKALPDHLCLRQHQHFGPSL